MEQTQENPQNQNSSEPIDEMPGQEHRMSPAPQFDDASYIGTRKLQDQVVLITGGDSGIGRATAVLAAKEGANVAIVYLDEHQDAQDTKHIVEGYSRRCILMAGDIGDEAFCKEVVHRTLEELGRIDHLILNAAEQHPVEDIKDISAEQLEKTFRTNIFSHFYLTKAAVDHLSEGSTIITCSSVNAYRGHDTLIDYSATKGAITAFTRSMARALVKRGIRVNSVAPGPIWTPLITSSFPPEQVASFGTNTPMGRAGEPVEVAKCFIFLASRDASYLTGQTLHPDGGMFVSS